MKNNPACWMRCTECGHRQMGCRSAIERRTRPRCSYCGGMLEISDAARNDLIVGMDRLRGVRAQRMAELGTKPNR